MTISLTAAQENKVKQLADEAGLTVAQMWKQILKHGFPTMEEYFKGIRQGESDIKAGRTYTTEQVFSGAKSRKAA